LDKLLTKGREMRNKAFALATVVVVGTLLGFAPTASADQPVTSETHFDRTRTIAAGVFCPFAFVVHTQGTIRETVFSSGKDVQRTVDFHVTYTNPATGKSVSTVLAGPFIEVPNGDGTVTVTINGNDGHETVPGEGTVWANVGKLVYIADPAAPEVPLTILKSSGQQGESQFPVTCEALS
jgi:hypothetical protein